MSEYVLGYILVLHFMSPGHVEEVTTLALQHSGNIIASASTASSYTACEIRIWTISSAKCTKVNEKGVRRGEGWEEWKEG